MISETERVASSFKDPSGYLFKENGVLYRKVQFSYKEHYDKLISSGLYEKLVQTNKMVAHKEISAEGDYYKILQPFFIEFISYPYEWSFSQLKDAALLTLEIQELALSHGLSLKDACAFNVAFTNCSPVFIDTLSFEKYIEGKSWIAYGQFCRHFLGPLLLMKYCDERLIKLLSTSLDGIELEILSRLLPKRTYLNFTVLMHIHLHSRAVSKYRDVRKKVNIGKMTLESQLLLVRQLKKSIHHLQPNHKTSSVWSKYYDTKSYNDAQFERKIEICKSLLIRLRPKTVWDLGCNTGQITALSASLNIPTIAIDSDHTSIEELYLNFRNKGLPVFPVYMDMMNPSPNCGWAAAERTSLNDRGPAEMVFAMALIHHLAITHNVMLTQVARWMNQICNGFLAIEFVPKEDIQIKRMLLNREDIFEDYNAEKFKEAFLNYFEIVESIPVLDSGRVIYLMKAK